MKKANLLLSLSLILTLVLTSVLTACGSNTTATNSPATVDAINISYVKLPLNVPSIVEKKLGLFEKNFGKDNIKVNFPEITEGPKMTEALSAGSLDFCNALGGTSAILAAANGVDLKIIGIYSRAPQAFTIMAKQDGIKSVSQLKGKKIAGPKGTILHQLLLAALNKEGIDPAAVEYINMSIPEAVAALNSGSVDAALVAGPAVPQALNAGAHIITTGEGLLDATIVIAVRGQFLQEHPDLVKRYMEVHQESLQYMKDHPEEVYQMAAEETGISIDDVKKMYGWYDFNPAITDKDIKDLNDTQEFLKQNGMLTKTVDIESLLANQ